MIEKCVVMVYQFSLYYKNVKCQENTGNTFVTFVKMCIRDSYHREVSEELARQIGQLLEGEDYRASGFHVLVVGLGNSSVTPDSLGPRVLNNLQVTRHLKVQYGDCLLYTSRCV